MTLDEAIEVLSLSAYSGSSTHNTRFKEALKLGIEALKRELAGDNLPLDKLLKRLPGETPEEKGSLHHAK